LFPVLPIFLVGAGPWRADAVAMSRKLQIASFWRVFAVQLARGKAAQVRRILVPLAQTSRRR